MAGQQALASEVSQKARLSQAKAAARRATGAAEQAEHAAALAGPALAKTTADAKHAMEVVKQDQTAFEWSKHVAKAEAALAERTTKLAKDEFETATNRSKASQKAVSSDETIREQLEENSAEAKKLLDATEYIRDSTDSEDIMKRQLATRSAETKAAQAAEAEQASQTSESRNNFAKFDAQSEMAIRAATDAAQNYGSADTAERVALEKLKLVLPRDEADKADAAARRARVQLEVQTPKEKVKTSGWDKQNALELKMAAKNSVGPVAMLGESADEGLEDEVSLNLGQNLHRAQLALDSGETADALSAYFAIPV